MTLFWASSLSAAGLLSVGRSLNPGLFVLLPESDLSLVEPVGVAARLAWALALRSCLRSPILPCSGRVRDCDRLLRTRYAVRKTLSANSAADGRWFLSVSPNSTIVELGVSGISSVGARSFVEIGRPSLESMLERPCADPLEDDDPESRLRAAIRSFLSFLSSRVVDVKVTVVDAIGDPNVFDERVSGEPLPLLPIVSRSTKVVCWEVVSAV